MNVLQKCCFRSMKNNRKRTVVTIVGIIMATALITGVACLAVSFRASMIEYQKKENGDYHYWFSGVSHENLKYFENNQNIKKLALAGEVGYAALPGSHNPDKPYLYIRAIDEEAVGAMALRLTEGRMPVNSSELVISRHIRANGLVDYQVGQELVLDIGQRISGNWQLHQDTAYTYEEERLETHETKTYTIVGIVERPNYVMEERMAPGYSVFTYLEEPKEAETLDIYATYTNWALWHADQVNTGILGAAKEEGQTQKVAKSVTENSRLVKLVLFSFSTGYMEMMYSMAAIAVIIIIVTSVFCIRNSFAISLMEKMKLYGRLASVGTSVRQQRQMVYYEAVFLGGVGIPLGIASGILASVLLVRGVSGMMKTALGIPMVFAISLPSILAAIILSAVTIFFSASGSARKAAKVSPISAIRANDMVKIRRRELKCPKLISRIFGVGGKVAYKNLRRARVKYRTTVISIVVSVTVFIGMNTFVQLVDLASRFYYEGQEYQMMVTIEGDSGKEQAEHIAGMKGVTEAEIVQGASFWIPTESLPITEDYRELFAVDGSMVVMVHSIGDSAYEEFCKKVGVSSKEAEDKAIVIAEYKHNYWKENKLYSDTGKIAQFRAGDVIGGVEEPGLEIEVIAQTEETPNFMARVNYNTPVLIVSDHWMEQQLDTLYDSTNFRVFDNMEVFLKCKDTSQLEEDIRRYLELSSYTLNNYDAQFQSERSLYAVIAIFLYGFITVVALIGITNIFNTVTTNMELRAPEFAMLKAIGMTDREFQRMIWLEGLFYGGKALLIGLPLGVLVSYAFNKAMGRGIVLRFHLPLGSMAVSTAAVFVLLFVIMRYSMGKLKRQNLVEIIQNENI
ncbi:MAG: ABC transporter permease [Acetatifactor sp.]|nr:ABC transporter permease [Acetatifactor sp.]